MIAVCDLGLWPRGRTPLQVHYIDGAVCAGAGNNLWGCQACMQLLQHREQRDTLVGISNADVLNAVGDRMW